MIYDRLRKLPKVIQMEIFETGDLTLLSDENTPLETLAELWEKLQEQFNNKYNKQGTSKIFNVSKEVEYLENRYTMIQMCCEALLFDKDEKIVGILHNEGYSFNVDSEDYLAQIDKIHRESKGILIKVNQLKNQLPKIDTDAVFENNIIEVMASYSAVLVIAFDFNTISVEAFHAYESQVKAKIKNLEAQANANKSKK